MTLSPNLSISASSKQRRNLKEACRVLFFEQLVTLVMFFSKVFDVENHVSIMRKSLISIFFRAGPICQPVTGAASIEKKIF